LGAWGVRGALPQRCTAGHRLGPVSGCWRFWLHVPLQHLHLHLHQPAANSCAGMLAEMTQLPKAPCWTQLSQPGPACKMLLRSCQPQRLTVSACRAPATQICQCRPAPHLPVLLVLAGAAVVGGAAAVGPGGITAEVVHAIQGHAAGAGAATALLERLEGLLAACSDRAGGSRGVSRRLGCVKDLRVCGGGVVGLESGWQGSLSRAQQQRYTCWQGTTAALHMLAGHNSSATHAGRAHCEIAAAAMVAPASCTRVLCDPDSRVHGAGTCATRAHASTQQCPLLTCAGGVH
jgi:hypothetical protein